MFEITVKYDLPKAHWKSVILQLTLADLAVFNLVDSTIEMGLESLWQPYPGLTEHRQHILATSSSIAQWVKTRPKTEV